MIGNLIRKVIPARFRPVGYLHKSVWDHVDGKVGAGPFKGMKYITDAHFSAYMPKLLGMYERELYPRIEAACAENFPLIVDIGAAEGYYACGMAMRCPNSRVVAYEGNPQGRQLLAEMAVKNGVRDRIDLRGYCNRTEMKSLLNGVERALMIVDCEGYELILLDPLRCEDLARMTIVVECHDLFIEGLTEELRERFAPTHDIEQIDATPREHSEFPVSTLYTRMLGQKRMAHSVSEWRASQMWWLWMTPKSA